MPGDDEAQRAEALDGYWDALGEGATPPDGGPLDPALGASVRRLHDLGAALSPDPIVLRTLREDLMKHHAATCPVPTLGALPEPTANGRLPSRLPPRPTPSARPIGRRRGRLGPWGRALDLAAVAALLLLGVGGTVIGNVGLPASVGFWQGDEKSGGGDGDVPMLGANPGRTGEQPGPGPDQAPGPRWQVFVGTGATSPVVVDGVVYLAGDTGSVAAYDAASGAQRWRTRVGGNASDPTVVGGSVYVGVVRNSETRNSTGFVAAYDAATGAQRWSSSTGSFGGSSPVVQDGVVYGTGDAEVFAFDTETGDELWRRVLPSGPCSCIGPGVAVAGGEVFAPGGDTLYALDAESGQERWRFRTEGDWLAMPVVADGRVYVGAGVWLDDTWSGKAGTVHAVDAATGDRVWTTVAVYVADAPAVANGVLYVPTMGFPGNAAPGTPEVEEYRELRDGLVALDAETGDRRWSVDLPQPGSQPAVVDDTVYVATNSYQDGSVAALDAASGEERWRLDLRGSVVASPAVVGGSLYVTNYHNGVLFALDETPAAGTPEGGGDLLRGEPCEPGPRRTVTGRPIGTVTAGSDRDLIEPWPVPEDRLPTGPAASAAAVTGIKILVAGLVRCGDAEPSLRSTYYSDDFYRRQFAKIGDDSTIAEVLASGWQASPSMPVVVRDARELPDGRIGAVVEGIGNPAFMAFVPSDDGWLVDQVVLLALDAAGAGTPVP